MTDAPGPREEMDADLREWLARYDRGGCPESDIPVLIRLVAQSRSREGVLEGLCKDARKILGNSYEAKALITRIDAALGGR